MKRVIVVGIQWGDEGKGKMIDLLSEKASVIVRAQGGNNAGHTIMIGDKEYRFHLVPSGIIYPHTRCYIAGGTVIDPQVLLKEIEGLQQKGIAVKGRLFLSRYAHVIMPYHRLLDKLLEQQKGSSAIGTTGRGIGPCYTDRAARIGIRICELMDQEIFAKRLRLALSIKNQELEKIFNHPPLEFDPIFSEYCHFAQQLFEIVGDVERAIEEAVSSKKAVLFEGAHGTFLDTNFGTYPYVTSSSTLAAGVCAGAAIGPTRIDHTLGVVKAYTTRVGNGPFPTALSKEEEVLFLDHHAAREIGTTTGRKRRMGWFDSALVREAIRFNGVDSLAITKIDVLDNLPYLKICTGYRFKGKLWDSPLPIAEHFEQAEPIYETVEGWQTPTGDIEKIQQMPKAARLYLERMEKLCGAPISILSLGPERHRTMILREIL